MDGPFFRYQNHDKYGYVIIKDQTFDINTFEDSYKALHGDIVTFDPDIQQITKVVKRGQKKLLGVLATSSKVTLGLSAKNVPKKRFMPLDKRFPNFAVQTKKPMQSSDSYAIIQTEDWTKDKYPTAIIDRIIGNVGDHNVEKECLRIKHNINWKKYRRFNIDDYITDLTPDRKDLTDLECFSIDPPNCRDIDDALHIRKITSDTFEVGIHIADVSSFIPVN